LDNSLPPRSAASTATAANDWKTTATTIGAVLLLIACTWFAARGWSASRPPSASDFTIYYEAARAVLDGGDPLQVSGFIYFPTFAVLLAPLAWLPIGVAAATWQALSVAALVASAHIAAELVNGSGRLARWAPWIALACVLRPIDSNLSNGQVNGFTLLVVLLSLRAYRADSQLSAGAWAGFGAALKLLPAVLIAWFALRRSKRAALAGLAAAVLIAAAPPVLALGARGAASSYAAWWEHVAHPYAAGGAELLEQHAYLPGQSLIAVGYRLLSSMTTKVSSGEVRSTFAPQTVRWIVDAAALAHVAAWAWLVSRRPTPSTAARAWRCDAALTLCLPLIVAPLVHKAHAVWCMLGFAVFFATGRHPARTTSAWLAAFAVFAIDFTTPALLGKHTTLPLLSIGVVFVGVEALFVALALESYRSRSPDASSTQ